MGGGDHVGMSAGRGTRGDNFRDHDDRGGRIVRNQFGFFGDGGGYSDDYGSYAYGSDDDTAVAYCLSRFRTYNPSTGTFIGNDGRPHACP
jgi:hypothetical protein